MKLVVARIDSSAGKWIVEVGEGPSSGQQVGFPHRTQREARRWIEEHGWLPWDHVRKDPREAVESGDMLVTVPREVLSRLLRERDTLDVEVRVQQMALVQFDGSAMRVAEARARLRGEVATSPWRHEA